MTGKGYVVQLQNRRWFLAKTGKHHTFWTADPALAAHFDTYNEAVRFAGSIVADFIVTADTP